jgi:hypothetical protein
MKKQQVDMLLEEVVIDGDRQIHIKFRAELVNLVDGNKIDELSNNVYLNPKAILRYNKYADKILM